MPGGFKYEVVLALHPAEDDPGALDLQMQFAFKNVRLALNMMEIESLALMQQTEVEGEEHLFAGFFLIAVSEGNATRLANALEVWFRGRQDRKVTLLSKEFEVEAMKISDINRLVDLISKNG